MKAFMAWDKEEIENVGTIIFAENAREAKRIAMATDVCEDAEFINIRVKRLKEADPLYKGKSEIDWYDEETRLALVRDLGWKCFEPSWECENCVAKNYCCWLEE